MASTAQAWQGNRKHQGRRKVDARRTAGRALPLEVELLEARTLLSYFASTANTIGVFEDQLPGGMSNALVQFMATHTDGTQKQTLAEINAFRAYNPNYTLVDYRLGTMAGPPQYIINGQWASDFNSTVNPNESWFLHQSYSGEPQSTSNLSSGRISDTPDNSYAMDISNPSWQNYWLTSELQDMAAVGANGVFADSFTYGIGGAGYDSPPLRYQGTNAANPADWPSGTTWTNQLANWATSIENTFTQFNAKNGTNYMFIPNLDARVTSWEPNWVDNASGAPIMDGAFLEGFGQWTDTYDWTLSMNRGLNFTDNNKIVIMQPYFTDTPDSATGQQERNFYMGTYLLLKGDQTYINMSDGGVAAQYFPEYQLNLGAPTTPLPSNVSSYLWNNVYRRDFQNGIVLVNPGTTSYTLNLGGTSKLVQGHGGGSMTDASLDASGNYTGGYLTEQGVQSITLAGGTAAILLNTTTATPPTVATPASATLNAAGTAAALSVLGADAGGESSLTYTWSASGPAGVRFSDNGSNSAKGATATFSQAGSYTLTVTLTDANHLTVTSSTTINVQQISTSIAISPTTASVADGSSEQLTATAADQFGQAISNPSILWSLSGPGALATTGLYSAPASGSGTATITAGSGSASASATVTVTAPATPTGFQTPPGSTTPPPTNAGFDELGAYRPGDGSWSLDSNGQFGFQNGPVAGPTPLADRVILGFSPTGANVIPVSGDWAGLGTTEIGDFKAGTWQLDLNNSGSLVAGDTFQFGAGGDVPVPGDYFGKGQECLAVWRPFPTLGYGEFLISDPNWLAEGQAGKTIGVASSFIFGAAGDHIVVGDWNGAGLTEVGVYRDAATYIAGDAGDAVFTLDVANHHTFDGSNSVFVFGIITDKVVIGDWDGSGTSKVGVYRPASAFSAPNTAVFSLDQHGQLDFSKDGNIFLYGTPSDEFVTGRWAFTTSTAAAETPGGAVSPLHDPTAPVTFAFS